LPRKYPSPSEAGGYAEKMETGAQCRLVDGPNEVDTEGRDKDKREGEKRKREKRKRERERERKKRRKKWEVSYSSGWLAPYR